MGYTLSEWRERKPYTDQDILELHARKAIDEKLLNKEKTNEDRG